MGSFLSRFFSRPVTGRKEDEARVISLLPDMSDWFEEDAGLLYPRWDLIRGWMRDSVPEPDYDQASDLAARIWLTRLAGICGESYQVAESNHFMFLSPLPPTGRKWALSAMENARRSIRLALGESGELEPQRGKQVVLALSAGIYPYYVSHYYSGEYMGRSAGVMISGGGFRHVAAQAPSTQYDDSQFLRTLAHELTHEALQWLYLPRWLDEALAMNFEDQLGGGEPSIVNRLQSRFESVTTRGLLREFCAWWTEERLQGFWSGLLWNSEEDEQSNCYEMARQIFHVIRRHMDKQGGNFRRFVVNAGFDDGGEAAALKYLDISLGDAAASLLGPGAWAPDPPSWNFPGD